MKTDPILVPLDLTGCAYEGVECVATLASKLKSRVILMNVVQIPAGVNPYATLMMDEQEWHTAREILDQDARALLEPFRMQLAAEDIRVTHFLGHGDVVEAILTAAKEVDAGMIVMGTHGRKGLERIMLGSVAEQVIRRASRPVMVVRSQDLSVHPGPSETVKRVQDEADG